METIGISCSCGNNHAFVLSRKLAECTHCVKLHNIEESQSYSTYDVIPLHVIEEQRAREQAVIDMWLDDMPYIDWSTCFQTNHQQFGVPF
jgi:hypothetical protein